MILIVDDDDVVRKFVSIVLKTNGYAPLVAASSESALERVRKLNRLDLMITDLGLPELCGTMLFEKVSVLHPETRPLYISGYTEEEASQLYKSDGFKGDFLGKPFLSQELMRRIEEILARPIR
jgi:two-component system, cell cycle sensor histidine kinase and response regulator CckA